MRSFAIQKNDFKHTHSEYFSPTIQPNDGGYFGLRIKQNQTLCMQTPTIIYA